MLSGELNIYPDTCTYYYGFNVTKPPFDDVLVRKAFSAAIDRETMVKDVVGSGVPATQFAPPGIFGAPDPEVGLPTDIEQAQAWLAEAGYPGGEGFPTVTLMHNTSEGHRAIAPISQQRLVALSHDIAQEFWTVRHLVSSLFSFHIKYHEFRNFRSSSDT